ncbi:hypothetical protein FHS57_005221 [Runella defluvii]|uniref:Uncharacterized protein n=1 Tax=Runella defluvii TaxID=370973 RepID=A0A7W6ESX4_9BACT|nr:hypothetical protein [Runella defluvii]
MMIALVAAGKNTKSAVGLDNYHPTICQRYAHKSVNKLPLSSSFVTLK